MLWRKKKEVLIVSTKEALKDAVDRKVPCIEVQGELADRMRWMGKISPGKIAALTGVMVAATAVSGPAVAVSGLSAAAIAEITGMDIACIIIACGLSVTLLIGIFKGYTIDCKSGDKTIRLIAKNS